MKRQKGWRMSCEVGEAKEDSSIFQPFLRYTYVTAHSPTFPSLHPRHSSFSNPSFASELCSFSNLSFTSPTSQLILQPFRRFSHVTAHSLTLTSLLLRHRLFTYVTWRAAHVVECVSIISRDITLLFLIPSIRTP